MLTCQKHLFNLEDGIHYINCAYQGPLLNETFQEAERQLLRKARPYQITKPDFFEPVKQAIRMFSDLIHSDDPERIVTMPSVSYGISSVAKNIPPKKNGRILLIDEQFPSNYYAWKRYADQHKVHVKIIREPDGATDRGKRWNKSILDSIDDSTIAIAMAHIHWADGTLYDLAAIREKSLRHNAMLIIDGTQSIGAMPFDVQHIRPDAVLCAGYKWLLGPYGFAFGYYNERFDDGVPIEENWINRLNSDDFQNLVNYEDRYQPKARRYAVGQNSNFIMVPMMVTSIRQILDWTVPAIQEYCSALTKTPVEHLKEMDCNIEADAYRSHHLFGIRLSDRIDRQKLLLALEENNVYVSFRGDAIRVSPHVYNTPDDLQQLVQCFKSAYRPSSISI